MIRRIIVCACAALALAFATAMVASAGQPHHVKPEPKKATIVTSSSSNDDNSGDNNDDQDKHEKKQEKKEEKKEKHRKLTDLSQSDMEDLFGTFVSLGLCAQEENPAVALPKCLAAVLSEVGFVVHPKPVE